MNKTRFASIALCCLFVALGVLQTRSAQAAIKTQTVEYKQGDTTLEGFLAYDDSIQSKRPGIIVVPGWNGVDDSGKMRAQMLAQLGYVAFVADVYGKGIRPSTSKEAAQEAGKYSRNRPLYRARMQAALDVLRRLHSSAIGKLAAIGYCFGGAGALELARSGADVAGVVTFHGDLSTPTPQDARNIKGRVLVLHGADDPAVPLKAVEALEKEMSDAKVDWQVVLYSGTVHSFTSPSAGNDNSRGSAYNERADKRSWIAMQDFFREIFTN